MNKVVFATLMLVSVVPASLRAEENKTTSIFSLPESVKPVEAILIPSPKQGSEITVAHRPVEVVRNGLPGQSVKVALDAQDLAPGTLLTVVGHIPGGEMFATPLQEIAESLPAPQSLATACKSGSTHKPLTGLSDDSLRKLINIREKKKLLLIERLKFALSPEMFSSFRQQERRFGLNYAKPLDESLNSEELIERLLVIGALAGLTPEN